MASQFTFAEDNGASVGTPATGTTRTLGRTECNWKNIDDSTTVYSSAPITAGNNSFGKYQFGAISGTFNQVSNGKFGHTSGIFGAGVALKVNISSGYATPSTTALGAGTVDITPATGLAASGLPVLFATSSGPAYASLSSITTTPTGYTQYFTTQLQTTTAAAPGDLPSGIELSLSYDES